MVKGKTYTKQEGLVLLLDALGTKGIWRDKDPSLVLDNWEQVVDTLVIDVEASKKRGIDFRYNAFSDTLIITMTGKTKEELLNEASVIVSALVSFCICFGVYFRGCISIGNFYRSERMILGPAIDEAAQYYEKANWVGVFVTPSSYSILKKQEEVKKSPNLFIKYDVPFHNGSYKTWAISLVENIAKVKLKQTRLIDLIHDKLENSSDPSSSEKWKNTLDFLYYVSTNSS